MKMSFFLYFLSVVTMYLLGDALQIEWLTFHYELTYEDGSLEEAGGSVIPFILATPILFQLRQNK